jgi:hypothetical protein
MTRFRKNSRRTFRRKKRPGMMMLPLSLCDELHTWSINPQACTDPFTTMLQLHPALVGAEAGPVSIVDPARPNQLVQQTLRKSLSVAGIRFWFDLGLNTVVSDQFAEVNHEARFAIIKTEVDATGSPSFFPNLWSTLDRDYGDVMWRQACTIYQPTLAGTTGGGSFAGSGLGFRSHAGNYGNWCTLQEPVLVKTRRRLGPNDAIWFVYSLKNNMPVETGGPIETTLNLFGVAAVRSNER